MPPISTPATQFNLSALSSILVATLRRSSGGGRLIKNLRLGTRRSRQTFLLLLIMWHLNAFLGRLAPFDDTRMKQKTRVNQLSQQVKSSVLEQPLELTFPLLEASDFSGVSRSTVFFGWLAGSLKLLYLHEDSDKLSTLASIIIDKIAITLQESLCRQTNFPVINKSPYTDNRSSRPPHTLSPWTVRSISQNSGIR